MQSRFSPDGRYARSSRTAMRKQDRAYEDFIESRISEVLWTRKSQAWEAELQLIEAE